MQMVIKLAARSHTTIKLPKQLEVQEDLSDQMNALIYISLWDTTKGEPYKTAKETVSVKKQDRFDENDQAIHAMVGEKKL